MASLKKRSITAFIWDMGGTFFGQGSAFVISIFLARLLEPTEFGLVGMAMVFINISHIFIDFGLSSALIQNQRNTNLTYSSVFYVNLLFGLLLTLFLYLIAPIIGNFYDNPEITYIVRWLSLVFIFSSLGQVQSVILRKKLNFKALTIQGLIATTFGGILGVLLAFQGWGVYALIVQQLTSALLGSFLIWKLSNWKPELMFSYKEIKNLTGFSLFVFLDSLFSTIFKNLDVLLIGKVFSPMVLGFYTRSVSLKDQVTNFSSLSLTKVFYPVLSELQDDDTEYSRIYFKVISVVSFLSFGLSGVLYVLGSDIILGLFGSKWAPSVPIFQVLILSVVNYPISSMIVNAFMSKGKSKENFVIGLYRKFIRIIPLLFAYFYGIFEFTVSLVVVNYFLTFVNIILLNKYTKLSIKAHFQKILEGLIPLLVVIIAFHLWEYNEFWHRLGLAMLYIIVYLIYNYVIKAEGMAFIMSNINQVRKKYYN